MPVMPLWQSTMLTALLALCEGNHRSPVVSPRQGPAKRTFLLANFEQTIVLPVISDASFHHTVMIYAYTKHSWRAPSDIAKNRPYRGLCVNWHFPFCCVVSGCRGHSGYTHLLFHRTITLLDSRASHLHTSWNWGEINWAATTGNMT